MHTTLLAKAAYTSRSAPTRTPHSSELELLNSITLRLTPACQAANYPDFVQALHDNNALWAQFAIDVADPENRLPADLRARLFYLAEFTMQHTPRILAGDAGPEVLADINTAVMRGLRQQGGGA